MDKPPPLMAGSVGQVVDEFGTRLGSSQGEFRAALKPLFMWMHRHGVKRVDVVRDGTKASTVVTADDVENVTVAELRTNP